VDHPQTDGQAEAQVAVVKHMIATLKSVINVNYDMVLGPGHWLFVWLVRHTSWVQNRFVGRGPMKKSALFAVHGYEYKGAALPFGEVVMAHWLVDGVRNGFVVSLWEKKRIPMPIWSPRMLASSRLGQLDVLCKRKLGPRKYSWSVAVYLGNLLRMLLHVRDRSRSRNLTQFP
jgi:hypothetical protein